MLNIKALKMEKITAWKLNFDRKNKKIPNFENFACQNIAAMETSIPESFYVNIEML